MNEAATHLGFGLGWHLPFDLTRMHSAPPHRTVDVYVDQRRVPDPSPTAVRVGVGRWLDEAQVLTVDVPHAGRFQILDAHHIRFDPAADCDEALRDLVLAGPIAGHILGRRGYLPVHASAISRGRATAVLLGASRAGVSTLTAALMQRGAKVVGDELIAIFLPRDGLPRVIGGSTSIQLPLDSAAKLGYTAADITRVRRGVARYDVPVDGSIRTARKITAIYHLGMANDRAITIRTPLPFLQANALLVGNWDLQVRRAMGAHSDDFIRASRVVAGMRFVRVLRPHLPRVTLNALVGLIEKELAR